MWCRSRVNGSRPVVLGMCWSSSMQVAPLTIGAVQVGLGQVEGPFVVAPRCPARTAATLRHRLVRHQPLLPMDGVHLCIISAPLPAAEPPVGVGVGQPSHLLTRLAAGRRVDQVGCLADFPSWLARGRLDPGQTPAGLPAAGSGVTAMTMRTRLGETAGAHLFHHPGAMDLDDAPAGTPGRRRSSCSVCRRSAGPAPRVPASLGWRCRWRCG